MTQISLIAGSI